MATASLGTVTEYAIGGNSWSNKTTNQSTNNNDNNRYYLGTSSGNNYRARFTLTVPSSINSNSVVTKLVVKIKADQAATPKYMRGFLTSTNYTNGNYENVTGSGKYDEISYLWLDESKSSRATDRQSSGGVDCYLVFDKGGYTPGKTYYVHILPYDSDSAANGSPTFSNTWWRGRNQSGYYTATCTYLGPYTVTYDANGGTGAPSSQTKIHGKALTLSSTKPTKSSTTDATYTVTYNTNGGNSISNATAKKTTTYTFNNWKGDNGSTYAAGASYTANANLKLTAQYTSKTSTTSVTLPKPTKTGYTFNGWYTAASGGSKIGNANDSYTPSASITLYAQWTAITYKVSFNGNGSTSGSMSDQTHTYGKSLALTANAFSKTGYTFKEWNTQANGSGTAYADKESVTNLASTQGATITLYAQWTAITYTVAYNGNGSTSGSMSNVTHTYDTAKTLTANTFQRSYTITYNANEGSVSPSSATATYTFTGWNTAADGSGTSYSDKASVKNLRTSSGTITLYAQWESASVTLPTPTRTGYAFTGWYDAASGGSKIGNANDSYTPTATKTIYAHWSQSTYFVKFNKNNSSATGSMNNQTIYVGQATKLNANTFALTGYDFQGWSTTPSGNVAYQDQQSVTDLTTAGNTYNLYAVWKKITYSITYNLNGGTGNAPATGHKEYGASYTIASTSAYKAGTASGHKVIFNSNGGNQNNQTKTAQDNVGYNFSKWNTNSNGTGTSYNAGARYTNNANLTLYAIYQTTNPTIKSKGQVTAPTVSKSSTTTSWTVNIDGNGGNGTTLTSNANITYQCSGWYTSNGDWRCNDKDSYTPDQNETLYAEWSSTTGSYSAVTLPSNLTRTGYTLVGYSTSSTASSAQYNAGSSYTPTRDNITLYAIWRPNIYTMTIDPNGGEIYSNGSWVSNNLTTRFAYGTNTFIGSPIAGTSHTVSLGTSTTLQLGTRTQSSWGGSSTYNISLTYSSEINNVSETNGVLNLKNPTSITITSLSNASTLIGKYISFNNKIYFIPSTATFSEVQSGSSWNKTYTLTSSASQEVSVVESTGSFSYTSNNIGRKTNYVFSGYDAPGGKTFLNSDGVTFYFDGEYPNNYENQASSTDTYVFNGQYAGDITITAQYRKAGFIITYKVNNPKLEDTFSWNDTIHEFGVPKEVQTATSTPIYEFLGWNTEADGSGTWYASGESVLNLAENDGEVITFYAQWKLKNLVQIHHNGSFQNAQLYVWTNNKWTLTTVYSWNNDGWKMSTGH